MAIWVHCRSCGQTYMTEPADRCSLCREPETLVDTDPPSLIRELVNRRDRTDKGVMLIVGVLGLFLGAAVGAGLSLGLPTAAAPQIGDAPAARQAENGGCGLGPAVSGFMGFAGNTFCGAAIGGVVSIAAFGVIRLATPRYWSDP